MDKRENEIPQDGAINHPYSSDSIGAPTSKRASTLSKQDRQDYLIFPTEL